MPIDFARLNAVLAQGTPPPQISPSQNGQTTGNSPDLNQPWDYKTAKTSPTGTSLPDGAKGFKPDGSPWFGDGLEGWWNDKKYMMGAPANPPKAEDWAGLKASASEIFSNAPVTKRLMDIVSTPINAASLALRAVNADAENSPIAPVVKGVTTGLSMLMDALQMPAIGIERGVGTLDLYATSHAGLGAENKPLSLDDAWQASRVLYSGLVNPTLYNTFLDRYHSGEDPVLLAQELQNPFAEIAGQIAFDPLNVLGKVNKAAEGEKVLADAVEQIKATSHLTPEIAKMLDDFVAVPNAERSAEEIQKFNDGIQSAQDIIKSKSMKQEYGLFKLASTSNQQVASLEMGDVFGLVAGSTARAHGDGEDIANVFKYMIQAASDDEATKTVGINGLMHMNNARTYFSEPFLKAGMYAKSLLEAEDGSINLDRITNVIKAAGDDPEKLCANLYKFVDAATEKYYPTVKEMETAFKQSETAVKTGTKVSFETQKMADAYRELDPGVKWISKIVAPAERIKGSINSVLGGFYFSQPGVSARNALNDSMSLMTDIGPSVYSMGPGKSLDSLKDWYDFSPRAAGGFKTTLATAEGKTWLSNLKSTVTAGLGGKSSMMADVERSSSAMAVRAMNDINMRKLVYAIPMDALSEIGFADKDVKNFRELILANRGDLDASVKSFQDITAGGTMDKWRVSMLNLSERDRGAMQEAGHYDDFVKLVSDPNTTKEQVVTFMKDKALEVKRMAFKAVNNTADVTAQDLKGIVSNIKAGSAEVLGDEGAINSATTLTAHLEAQDQAENAYFKALSQMRDKVMYTLGSQGDKGTASEITKAFNGHMDLISSSRAHTVEETQGFVQEMRSVAERAKTNSTKLLDLWSELDLGTPPPDLNKQILLSKGWDMTRVKVATSWEAHFGDSIKSSEAIHGLFTNSGADITDLEALYNDAVDKTTYAQSLRSALYNGGMIYSDKEASALNVINKSRLAGEDPVLGLRKVLKEFDVGTVVGDATGPRGASMDRQALATINKFLPDGEKFTSIDEAAANPEKAVQGLLARGKANGSLFDLKGIQSLPVQALEEDVPDLQRISAQLKEANSKISSLEVKLDINKTDPMTKLPILKRQPELAANAQHFGYIDVRGMKTVNDSLGHAQGDEMIKQFGSILRDIQSENPGVTIARKYGEGDEFVVMFDKNDPVAAKTLMDKINNEFHTSMIVLEDEHGNPVVKQGFSIWTGTGKTEKEADLSINAAKQAYTDATDQRVFTPGLRDVSPAEPGYDTAIAARNAAGADAAGAVHGTAEPAAAAGGTANAVPSGNATGVSELQGGGNSATGTPGVPEPPVNPQESAGRSQVVPPSRNGAYEPAVPPTALGAPQTVFNGYNHSKSGYMEMYDRLTQQVMDEWGQKTKSASGTLANEQKLAEFVHGDLADKMETARAVSLKSAEYWRDFAMHSYGSKTYADLALSYVMPYHFWYDRTYLNWAKRLTTDPQIIAAYAKYKRLMENVNATSPDWWKYNISTDLLGIDLKNPIFLNLEQAVWPLQGLTGVDFNDPYKRVDWLTSTIDDLGKFGPNVWGPIQMAVAGNLMMQGENDAAARWGGRLIPQTATLKSALALTGVNLASLPNKGELDPNVNFFAHGKDPYEQAQIGRALGSLVGKDFQGTTVTQEMADDAARQGDGPLWDKALQDAVSMRAPGKLASFMLGVGFKARTTDDMQIDKFYSEYRGVKAIWNTLNADDRRNTMDALRVKYPFMDTVLISRMGSTDRDMAYSYNVLSRIPPGQKSQLLQQAGIDQSVLDQFYASKSTDPFSGMTATDKDRFMAGIVDLGAMLKLPSDATQTEWNQAISQYTNFLTQSQAQYGNSVWDEVTEYYALYNPKDSNVADTYLQNHPEVNQAIMAREQFKISNPLVYKYYGSMNTVWSYYSSWVYGELNKKYGADMSQKENDYYNEALTNPNAVKTPEMKAYDKDKIALFDQANKMAVNLVDHMPLNNTGYAVRPDFKPQSVDQMNLRNAALPVNDYPSWTDWQSIMSPSEQNLVMAYFTKNQPLSYSAQSQLTYDMRTFGFTNVNKALEAIGVALSKP